MRLWEPGVAKQLGRIADALEDIVKLQIASQGGRQRVGGLHLSLGGDRSSEGEWVGYTDELEDLQREKAEKQQGLLKGMRRGG